MIDLVLVLLITGVGGYIFISIVTYIEKSKVRRLRFISKVPGHEGKCYPIWLNTNSIHIRIDGGITGFFVLLGDKSKTSFHGIIKGEGVFTTENL